MPSASDPVNLLRALSSALRAHRCRWYLFGAQAVVIWGRPRLTTDVDVTVRLESGTAEDLVATLTAAGFRLPDGFTDEFVHATRVLPLVHESSGMPLDIVLAGRPKDVEDIRGVLYLRAMSLDLGYIRRTLAAIETALGQSDFQPLFEAELLRVQKSG